MVLRNFSFPFGHFHFVVVDDWRVSDWPKYPETFGSSLCPACPAVNFKKMCEIACLLFCVLLHDVFGVKKQKMAPISLKDPNIQGLTEEFVKTLTGFKVARAHFMHRNISISLRGKMLFFLQKSSRNFTLSVQFALSNFR